MKLLIDIPEHIYEHAKETTEDSRDEFDAMRAIANGSQQRSGRWIQKEEEGDAEPFIIWECSECHCVDEDGKPSYKYCPQCGARMEVQE